MPGFDIKSILDFNPPTYACPACRGLFRDVERSKDDAGTFHACCPVCKSEFVQDPSPWTKETQYPPRWLHAHGHGINHGNELMDHSKALATLLRKAESGDDPWSSIQAWPTARLLLEVLAISKHFVHFTTYGISHVMIGALKMTSMRVPVYGFASNVEDHARVELVEMNSEAPNLHAKVIPSSIRAADAPHQKLIVVDGLLAFKGSANLTNSGMRKADRGLDISEVVTDYEQVTDLNNRYFAPVWKRITVGDQSEIVMDSSPW